MRLAERTSEDVAVAAAGVERAKARVTEARSGFFPTLSASASYTRTFISQFDDLFDARGGQMGQAEGAGELPFGQPNIYQLALTASQNLFAGGSTLALGRQARANLSISRAELSSSRAQAVLEAVQAYYDAVLAARLVEIAEATLNQAQQTLEQTRLEVQEGRKPEFELLRAQVARDNEQPQVVQRRTELELAHLRLKQVLDLDAPGRLVLTTELEHDALPALAPRAKASAAVARRGERVPVQQALDTVRLQQATVDLQNAAHFPSLTLTSTYARFAYPEDLLPSWSDFRTNFNAGLVLQVPIFEGFATVARVRAARADLEEARIRVAQTRELAQYDTEQARQRLRAAIEVWRASAGTVEQAERAYELAELRYREGVSTQLELDDARLLLQRARLNRAVAARDLQVARVRWELLPALPLSVATPPVVSAPELDPLGTMGAGAPGSGAAATPGTGASIPGVTDMPGVPWPTGLPGAF